MTPEEMLGLISTDAKKHLLTPNTQEYLSKWRVAAQADYKFEDFPRLARLESSWEMIVKQIPFAFLSEVRESQKYGDPLSMFMGYLASGYYPPPEVMLSLLSCFEFFYERKGQQSLDEIFFGKPYGKKRNDSFAHYNNMRFRKFEIYHKKRIVKLDAHSGSHALTLTASFREYLNSEEYSGPKESEEAFLKAYRRWLKKVKKQDS